jgi:hypothetical protein
LPPKIHPSTPLCHRGQDHASDFHGTRFSAFTVLTARAQPVYGLATLDIAPRMRGRPSGR